VVDLPLSGLPDAQSFRSERVPKRRRKAVIGNAEACRS
jgi:hypothetical protein